MSRDYTSEPFDGFDVLQCGACEDNYRELNFEASINCKISLKVSIGAAIEDFNETGQVVWPAAPLLAYFLISDFGKDIVLGKKIIELGSGVGIPGLVSAYFAQKVLLTDHNPSSLALLRRNVALNSRNSNSDVSVSALDWGSSLPQELVANFDVVIGADLVYATTAADSLFATAEAVLTRQPSALFILSHVSR